MISLVKGKILFSITVKVLTFGWDNSRCGFRSIVVLEKKNNK